MNARKVALKILFAVETRKSFGDILLQKTLERSALEKRDKDFVTNLVRGTLVWKGRIDYFLNALRKEGIETIPAWIRTILRMGAYEILFLEGIPERATVDEAVKLAKEFGHPGTAGIVNAVLRKLATEKDKLPYPEKEKSPCWYLAVRYSHPEWMVERWMKRFGFGETEKLLEANNERIGVSIRVNSIKSGRDEVRDSLLKDGVKVEDGRYSKSNLTVLGSFSPTANNGFREGHFTIQDESESLVSFLLAPKERELIIDLCAAPGGKSTHIAEITRDSSTIVAIDRYLHRTRKTEENARRLGFHSLRLIVADGRAPALKLKADRVLVDAPCSGLGILGKRPDARWRKKESSIQEMSSLQVELLLSGAELVKKGGVLAYSVCTFEPEETSGVIEKFFENRREFSLESAEGFLPPEVLDERGIMRTFPHIHGTDGAFAARLVRR